MGRRSDSDPDLAVPPTAVPRRHRLLNLRRSATGELLVGCTGFQFVEGRDTDEPLRRWWNSVEPAELHGLLVRSMLRDRQGRLLLGTTDGIWRSRPQDPAADGWRFQQLSDTRGWEVRVLEADGHGGVWVGTNGVGTAHLRGDELEWFGVSDGLTSSLIRDLHADPEGRILIATEDQGLLVYSPESEPSFTAIRKRDGLWDNSIHSIQPDLRGWLWISSNRGIFRLDQRQLDAFLAGEATQIDSIGYTEEDGMGDREANGGFQSSGFRAQDGRMWFPTQNGVAVFDPTSLLEDASGSEIYVLALRAGRDSVPLPVKTGTKSLRLTPAQRSFEVQYTVIALNAPDRVRTRYRLEGYGEDWIDAGDRRSAFFTQVPPGRYTFHVQARSADGVWNLEGDRVEITIAPYLWETTWLRAIAALSLLAAAFAGLRFRELRQQARSRQLEATVEARTQALAEERDTVARQAQQLAVLDRARSDFFANVSHELRTPLALILGPIKDLLEEELGPLTAKQRRDLIQMRANGSRLLTLVNQLLDSARLEAGGFELEVSQTELRGYVTGVVARFLPAAEARRLELIQDFPDEAVWLWIDPEQLDKVLSNLLSNAVRCTEAGGRISIELDVGDDDVDLTVRDTGRGIAAEEIPRLFERFFQGGNTADKAVGTGIGLALSKELVELHGGRLTVDSQMGVGSAFTVSLRRDRDHFQAAQIRAEPIPGAGAIIPSHSLFAGQALIVEDELSDRQTSGASRLASKDVPESEPVEMPKRLPSPTSSGENGDADRALILLVDDHPGVRSYVQRHLETRYRVALARDGDEALASARVTVPDLIVSDVMMPLPPGAPPDAPEDGLALCRAIKEDPDLDFIPIVLLTARASIDDRLEGLGFGADDYLAKPFDARELLARVDNLITQRLRLRERYFGRSEEIGQPSLPLAEGIEPNRDELRWL
ncbi:MAG: ATP-binding protein, partial [Thermoanaerobaculia bacterium]|nr:ATP-binding protein [Thermoanaerobaculia bacterium]